MHPFRFLHSADLHLGTPFRGLSRRLPTPWADRLQTASYRVFQRIVDVAIREQVQFVTLGGDLLDSASVGMGPRFEILRGLERLQQHGIRVFLIHGNHDPLQDEGIPWPGQVHVFPPLPIPDAAPAESALWSPDGRTRVQISGFSHANGAPDVRTAHRFRRLPNVDFAIGLLHGSVGAGYGHRPWYPATVEELRRTGFDVFALGHIHHPQVLQADHPLIVYPGNPQGRDVGERGARGVVLVDVDTEGFPSSRFIPTADVVWDVLNISLEDVNDLTGFRSVLVEALVRMQNDGIPRIVRICLTGRTSLFAWFQQHADVVAVIEEELAAAGIQVLVEQVEVAVEPDLDLDTLAASQTVLGTLLRQCEFYLERPESAREVFASILSPVFHPGNGLSLLDIDDQGWRNLIAEARRLVLAQLPESGASS